MNDVGSREHNWMLELKYLITPDKGEDTPAFKKPTEADM